MKEYVRKIWEKYHEHAPKWLQDALSPCMVGAAVHDIFPFIPLQEIKETQYLLNNNSPLMWIPNYVIEKSEEYMKNPDQCTVSPWVYNTEKYFPNVDFVWIDTILNGRTRDYERIRKDIYEGALELSRVQPCYDLRDLISYMRKRFSEHPLLI
jgi:hypothetical protein